MLDGTLKLQKKQFFSNFFSKTVVQKDAKNVGFNVSFFEKCSFKTTFVFVIPQTVLALEGF